MTAIPSIAFICVEGAVDAVLGRPRAENPYSRESAFEHWFAWNEGWDEGTELFEMRGREEAARWLAA